MIGLLDGTVYDVSTDHFILMVGGVGYDISASAQTLTDVHVLVGQPMKVWIHSHVREDAFQLFGFLTKPEKEFFLQLLKVNGVGPKMALSIMSGARVAQIQDWIEASDAKALSALPKVGKKTAEQIILTLQFCDYQIIILFKNLNMKTQFHNKNNYFAVNCKVNLCIIFLTNFVLKLRTDFGSLFH